MIILIIKNNTSLVIVVGHPIIDSFLAIVLGRAKAVRFVRHYRPRVEMIRRALPRVQRTNNLNANKNYNRFF